MTEKRHSGASRAKPSSRKDKRAHRTKGGLHEQGFNYALAGALRDANARWRDDSECVIAEGTGAGKRIDILIDDKNAIPPVAIECAYGGDNDMDAVARLDQDVCKTAVAVRIPLHFKDVDSDEARSMLQDGREIDYALLQRHGDDAFRFPAKGYAVGSARDLASLIHAAAVPKDQVESVADSVAELINRAAKMLESGLSDSDHDAVVKKVHQNSSLSALRTVVVLWLDAMLVQQHLRMTVGDTIDALPFSKIKPSELAKSWRRILESNWRSIFAPAVDVLEDLGPKSRKYVAKTLDILNEAVESIATAQIGQHVNIAGELFPKISGDRRESAAFYTTPATAELLAALLIRERDDHKWRDPELFNSLRIADLACGTGTLIRAAFQRVRTLHEASGGDSKSVSTLHTLAMEIGIIAADVSPIAAHLTNSSMALSGLGEKYGSTSIGWVGVGRSIARSNLLTTGSLEYLRERQLTDMFDELGAAAAGTQEENTSEKTSENTSITVDFNSVDYVIMNPPYSRTRGGQSAFDIAGLSEDARARCQRRWGNLLSKEPALKTAGMAASFLCLAQRKVKRGGRIGFVLPMSAAFMGTWEKTRNMLVREFEDVVAIVQAGARGGAAALSADTGMAEMLLCATRKQDMKDTKVSKVRCVTLRRVPLRLGEAGEFARSIQKSLDNDRSSIVPVKVGEEEIGQVVRFRPNAGEPWSRLGVLHTDLSVAAYMLAEEGCLFDMAGGEHMELSRPMKQMDDVFEIGPTHHLIGHLADGDEIGAFVLHEITRLADRIGPDRVLWKADAGEQRKLVVYPTHKGIAINKETLERVQSRTSTLHYARGMRWTSQALLAASTPTEVHGGRAWTSLTCREDLAQNEVHAHKAFALWANSTLGMVVHWARAGRTQHGRAPMQVKEIHKVPCPDFGVLERPKLQDAAEAFDQLKEESLRPACQAHCDPVRHQIDKAVIAMFDLPAERAEASVSAIRNLWCSEPTVHGDNRAALDELRRNGLINSL